jgi:hypothetical protein
LLTPSQWNYSDISRQTRRTHPARQRRIASTYPAPESLHGKGEADRRCGSRRARSSLCKRSSE